MRLFEALKQKVRRTLLKREDTLEGTVTKYFDSRRFGFIRATSGPLDDRDAFFHVTDVTDRTPLLVGQPVTFALKERNGKLRAVRVRPASIPRER